MELRHLRYFVAVVEEQSFTKAAEKLFIAQPPLSRQIQNLESELGIQLFERGSRPLQTTGNSLLKMVPMVTTFLLCTGTMQQRLNTVKKLKLPIISVP